eukprot:sb/3477279/
MVGAARQYSNELNKEPCDVIVMSSQIFDQKKIIMGVPPNLSKYFTQNALTSNYKTSSLFNSLSLVNVTNSLSHKLPSVIVTKGGKTDGIILGDTTTRRRINSVPLSFFI